MEENEDGKVPERFTEQALEQVQELEQVSQEDRLSSFGFFSSVDKFFDKIGDPDKFVDDIAERVRATNEAIKRLREVVVAVKDGTMSDEQAMEILINVIATKEQAEEFLSELHNTFEGDCDEGGYCCDGECCCEDEDCCCDDDCVERTVNENFNGFCKQEEPGTAHVDSVKFNAKVDTDGDENTTK